MDSVKRYFEVGNISLFARCWGASDGIPVLALHGWLDNCASFDPLADALSKNCYVVALDLAGHGLSDHRGHLGAYNIWQDVAEVFSVADQLGWETFNLIGHSRGAMTAFLAAGTFAERINCLIMLEGIAPQIAEPSEAPQILANAVTFLNTRKRRGRQFYTTFDDAVRARENGLVPVSFADAECLARHGVEESANGFFWRYDIKLMIGSEVRFSWAQIDAFKARLPPRKLLVCADQGLLLNDPHLLAWLPTIEGLRQMTLPGDHHFHMHSGYKVLAMELLKFLQGSSDS